MTTLLEDIVKVWNNKWTLPIFSLLVAAAPVVTKVVLDEISTHRGITRYLNEMSYSASGFSPEGDAQRAYLQNWVWDL